VAKKKAARPRTLDRAQERKREKLYQARVKLALLDAGGSPERPLDVSSASVLELRAEAEPCLRCGDVARCNEHTTHQGPNGLLRLLKLECRNCGTERSLYFRIVASYLN
jgi:hypothetical protein